MADTLVDGAPHADAHMFPHSNSGPFWADRNTGAVIFVDSNNDLVAKRTTDGGATWGTNAAAESGTVIGFACWYGKETSGLSSSTTLYVVWGDSAGSTFRFATYDVATGSWGTPATIQGGLTWAGSRGDSMFVTVARSGRIYAGYNASGSSMGAEESVDGGSSWAAIASPWESVLDWAMGAFLHVTDTNDCAIVFWDSSANSVSFKSYDETANAWTETAVGSSVSDTNARLNWACVARVDSFDIYLFAWNAYDTTTADLKAWEINASSLTPSVDALPDVLTNSAESFGVGGLAEGTQVYVCYFRGGTVDDTVTPYYKYTDDGGASWQTEAAMGESADDHRYISAGVLHDDSGGHFMPFWFDDDDEDLYVNLVNSLAFGPIIESAAAALSMGLTMAAAAQHTEAGAAALGLAIVTATDGSLTFEAAAGLALALTLAAVAQREISADAAFATTLSLAADGNFGILEGEAPLALALTLAAAGSRVQSADLAMALELAAAPVAAIQNEGAAALALALTLAAAATTIRFHRAVRPPAGLGGYTMRPQAGSGRMRP